MTRADLYIMSFSLGLALSALSGCAGSKVIGGQSRHDSGGVIVTYAAPGGGTISVTDTRESTATTQPSIAVTGDKTSLKAESVGAGDTQIAGFTIRTEEFRQTPTSWGLVAILIVCGILAYSIGNIPAAIMCGAGVVLAFIYPAALVWTALLAVAWVLYSHRAAIVQLVRGNQNAIEQLPAAQQETVKDELAKAQAPALRKVVSAIKTATKV